MESEGCFKTNLNSVIEMILDEEKLVTYVTLSKDLCVHVNYSKKLLYNAVVHIRREHPNIELNVSYIISGLSDNTAGETTLCTENNLDKYKERYKTIFFYHIYSVSKGPPQIDSTAFLLLNKFEDYNLCMGLIKSKECTKRSSDEISNLKTNSQEFILIENAPVITSHKKVKNETSNGPALTIKEQLQENKPHEIKKNTPIKKEQVAEKKPHEIKIKSEITSPKKEITNNKSTVTKANGHKSQKGIASFFNKGNVTQNKKATKEINENVLNSISEKNNQVKEEKMDIDNASTESVVNSTIKHEVTENKIGKVETKPNNKNEIKNVKSPKQNKKLTKGDKKRKRVYQIAESDSEEENDPFADKQDVNNESDDEIPPTPLAENNIKITSGIVNPRKRRKIVDKTYVDDDGFMLTKKEEVYESCSEQEEEIKDKKEIKAEAKVELEISPKDKKTSPKKSKKKISPPQKGKQPTLNSFFQRK